MKMSLDPASSVHQTIFFYYSAKEKSRNSTGVKSSLMSWPNCITASAGVVVKKNMSASVYFISISRFFFFFFKYGAVTGASHLSRPAAAVLPAGPSSSTRKEKHSSLQFFHPATVITRPFFLSFFAARAPSDSNY